MNLKSLKKIFLPQELTDITCGLERETTRVSREGEIVNTPHPEVFGSKLDNPYITTDFAECQIEMITPPIKSSEKLYDFINELYNISAAEIGDEYLWPYSMPAEITDDVRTAEYEDTEAGREAHKYRQNLKEKYGAAKQLICGIHCNISFGDSFIDKLYKNKELITDKEMSRKEFKNAVYLKLARNYLRYNWIIIYLLGASSRMHESFSQNQKKNISDEKEVSYRNGKEGYTNKIEIYPDYSTVDSYINSINAFVKEGKIGSHKEVYSSVRLKAYKAEDFLNSLKEDGIKYLEYRSIDINPFEKGGIALEDIRFLKLINYYLLCKDESTYENWQSEAEYNKKTAADEGLSNPVLKRDGKDITLKAWAEEVLKELAEINEFLCLKLDNTVKSAMEKVKDTKLTYSYRINRTVKEKGYINTFMELSKKYKHDALYAGYKFAGFEDLELSTQILIKEAVKRGIKVKVIDRAENFVSLSKNGKIEYVKQATKSSKDTYVSALIMENKSVTKTVLRDHNINVPDGCEIHSSEDTDAEIEITAEKYENIPVVIKPKSTNFGLGISIFSEGTDRKNLKRALEIAFSYDKTVLVEQFVKGKEYRILVMGGEVVGILSRVPANVTGDGTKTIRELVEEKNQDPLRGEHYVRPLEKIRLDENAELFLKTQGKTFDYVPERDETVYLRENSNISTGGDSIDYTDDIPKFYKKTAVKAAEAVGANVCGVDMMIEDYKEDRGKYSIIELNFNPAIHIHCYPYKGKNRKAGEKMLKLLGF